MRPKCDLLVSEATHQQVTFITVLFQLDLLKERGEHRSEQKTSNDISRADWLLLRIVARL